MQENAAIICPLSICSAEDCPKDKCSRKRGAIPARGHVKAVRLLRPMKGCSRAELVATSDGAQYVTKWVQGPQGRRSLISEVITTFVLRNLGARVPDIALIDVDTPLIEEYHERCAQRASRPVPIERGLHFGSRVMPDPSRSTMYDIFPRSLLGRVSNLADFATCLVVDKWLNNQDYRQAVFYNQGMWVADLIDHGLSCGGMNWCFQDSPLFGLYRDYGVYDGIVDWDDLAPLVDNIESGFVEDVIGAAIRQIPDQWLTGDPGRSDVTLLCERLLGRRRQIKRLLSEVIESPLQIVRKWGATKMGMDRVTRTAPPRATATTA